MTVISKLKEIANNLMKKANPNITIISDIGDKTFSSIPEAMKAVQYWYQDWWSEKTNILYPDPPPLSDYTEDLPGLEGIIYDTLHLLAEVALRNMSQSQSWNRQQQEQWMDEFVDDLRLDVKQA